MLWKSPALFALILFGACSARFADAQEAALKAVPYIGKEEPYFLGNGIAGGGGDTHGKWDFLIGPDYTSPNFLSEETLGLMIDGQPMALVLQMHRARETGVFFGSQRIGDLEVWVSDIAKADSPFVTRVIRCVNRSRRNTSKVSVFADVSPAKGILCAGTDKALVLQAPKGIPCFDGEAKNWVDRYSRISFSEETGVRQAGNRFQLKTAEHSLAPGATLSTGLYHWQSDDAPPSPKSLDEWAKARNPEAELRLCVAAWQKWSRNGSRALSRVSDARTHDAVEGCLIACKMQQDRDGGTIAGVRRYSESYIRDSHGALGLFLATGHTLEARKIIETIDHKWSVAGFIPNYWSMGSDSFLGRSFANDSSEITGYYLLMLRDYLAKTHDHAFASTVEKSIRFAIDSELDSLEKNDWRISFNGDETEKYCVRVDGQEYGGFPAFSEWRNDSWSFPSAAIAVASTQFYIDYLTATGRKTDAVPYAEKLKKLRDGIDATFWRPELLEAHHYWARFKDGGWPKVTVPNYDLIPLWVGAKLNDDRQKADALSVKAEINPKTGMLPTAPPDVLGYCGHNLGYLLSDLTALRDPMAKDVENTIMRSGLMGCWGTVSEFYGPNGTSNGHNYRVFESGITAEAILRYYSR